MEITEVNDGAKSLKAIGLQFSAMTAAECSWLEGELKGNLTLSRLDEETLLSFINVYELRHLKENAFDTNVQAQIDAIWEKHRIIWRGQKFTFDLTCQPLVYSIINVTPDSFYDGAAEHLSTDYAVQRAAADLTAGADVIELGGKSSRPGYDDISPEEEWQRLAEPLRQIRQQFPTAVIAVDTDEPYLMEQVLEAGADIINDIDGFDTPEKLAVLAKYKPAVVVMNNGRAGLQYADNVADELVPYFTAKQAELTAIGLTADQLCLDAGVGFTNGASGLDSLIRTQATGPLTTLGLPVMVAISRKSYLKNIFGADGEERLVATMLLEQIMMQDGARVLRVHDAAVTRRLIDGFNKYYG